jgi:predicted DNA binding CopG/RHH family protein
MNVHESATKRRLVQLRISDADYDVLKKYAAHLRIPISSAIRMIVIQKIEEAKK